MKHRGVRLHCLCLHERFRALELRCKPRDKSTGTDVDPRCPHTARHYWGPKKPWQLEADNRGRVAHYLAHTNFRNMNESTCARRFEGWADSGRLPTVNASKPPGRNNGKLQRVR